MRALVLLACSLLLQPSYAFRRSDWKLPMGFEIALYSDTPVNSARSLSCSKGSKRGGPIITYVGARSSEPQDVSGAATTAQVLCLHVPATFTSLACLLTTAGRCSRGSNRAWQGPLCASGCLCSLCSCLLVDSVASCQQVVNPCSMHCVQTIIKGLCPQPNGVAWNKGSLFIACPSQVRLKAVAAARGVEGNAADVRQWRQCNATSVCPADLPGCYSAVCSVLYHPQLYRLDNADSYALSKKAAPLSALKLVLTLPAEASHGCAAWRPAHCWLYLLGYICATSPAAHAVFAPCCDPLPPSLQVEVHPFWPRQQAVHPHRSPLQCLQTRQHLVRSSVTALGVEASSLLVCVLVLGSRHTSAVLSHCEQCWPGGGSAHTQTRCSVLRRASCCRVNGRRWQFGSIYRVNRNGSNVTLVAQGETAA